RPEFTIRSQPRTSAHNRPISYSVANDLEIHMRLHFLRKLLLTASISIGAPFVAFAQPQAPATPKAVARPARRPIPPAQYIPAHDYDQRNIKLDLRFDWEKEQAIGTATI